jgi:EAL domain-containing protein (putative c-di-GMP-specific phosphodiesterase class I)
VIGPSAFIQVAEETGLIEAIGDWVLHRAVTVAAGWHRTMPPGVYVSVNVSAHQLRQGRDGSTTGFAEKVDRELAAAGLPPENLMLELTESVLLGEEDQVWAELTTLRDTGVRLAIDDFGTGFSSMRYLLHTPIDVIKIDKSFVRSVATSPRRQAVVDGIVRLGQALGLRVVAEGIETAADRDVLTTMGCPYGQGFLYSAPIGPVEAHRWLAGRGDEYAHSGGTPAPPGTLPT